MKMAVQGVHTRLVNYNQIRGRVADQVDMEFIDYIDRYRTHPFKFLEDLSVFVGPLIPLFWTSVLVHLWA